MDSVGSPQPVEREIGASLAASDPHRPLRWLGGMLVAALALMGVALGIGARWLRAEADRRILAQFPTDAATYRALDPALLAPSIDRLGEMAREGHPEALARLMAIWDVADGEPRRHLALQLLTTLKTDPQPFLRELARLPVAARTGVGRLIAADPHFATERPALEDGVRRAIRSQAALREAAEDLLQAFARAAHGGA